MKIQRTLFRKLTLSVFEEQVNQRTTYFTAYFNIPSEIHVTSFLSSAGLLVTSYYL